MNDERVTKAKLYTFSEIKDLIARASARSISKTLDDEDVDGVKVVLVETLVGAKIVAELDLMHEEGEI